MSTRVKLLTGPGTSAEQWGMNATDLGIVRRVGQGPGVPGFNLYVFGDTFDQAVGGSGWRSPVALRSPAYKAAGLNAGVNFDSAVGGGYAKQLLPYQHGVGFSTVLPTDVLRVGGNRLFMHCMVIGFGGLDDVLWTETHESTDNGDNWRHIGNSGRREGGEWGGLFRMLTWEWDETTDTVYIMTSGGLARNKGVILWRAPAATVWNKDTWQAWGFANGSWNWGNYPTNIMPNGTTVGELNLRKVQGQWLFTYFETAPQSRIVTRVLTAPNANIGAAPAYTIVTNAPWELEWWNKNNTLPQLYGGYLVDGSTLDEPHYVVSQWRNPSPSNWPYRSVQFKGPKLNPVNPITA